MTQSRKVGWGSSNGFRVRLFKAIEPLTCHDCGAEIAVGELFTRGARGVRTTMPLCERCRPFSLASAPARSPMISTD